MASHNLSSCERLGDAHRDVLFRAVRNVLASELAFTTLAQIVDGLPTFSVYKEMSYGDEKDPDFPLITHVEICPPALVKTKELLSEFDPSTLRFRDRLLNKFEAAEPSSKSFSLRLIELVAVAIHQLAVRFHRLGLQLHDPQTTKGQDVDSVVAYQHPPVRNRYGNMIKSNKIRYPTRFHAVFGDVECYPEGVHDIVGFWAEKCILGGVAVFKRSHGWKRRGKPEPNVYFDSERRNVTFLICRLLDKQQDDLLRFLTCDKMAASEEEANWCPLPILPGYYNRTRVEPVDALYRSVYREKWERKVLPHFERMQRKRRCYRNSFLDYPEIHEFNLRFEKEEEEERERREKEEERLLQQKTGGDDKSAFSFNTRLNIRLELSSDGASSQPTPGTPTTSE